jgi:hypothetical protein
LQAEEQEEYFAKCLLRAGQMTIPAAKLFPPSKGLAEFKSTLESPI